MLNSSVHAASTAASTTGRYSGLAAGHHRVDRDLLDRALDEVGRHDGDDLVRARGSCPRACAAPAPRSAATTGRPSVQPRSNSASTSSSSSASSTRRLRSIDAAEAHARARRRGRGRRDSEPQPGRMLGQVRAEPGHAGERLPLPRAASRRSGRPPRRPSTRISVGTVSMSWCQLTARSVSSHGGDPGGERRVVLRVDGERRGAAGELCEHRARRARRSGSRASRRRRDRRAARRRGHHDARIMRSGSCGQELHDPPVDHLRLFEVEEVAGAVDDLDR